MYIAQFPTVTWTLDKTPTRDILKFRQAAWDPPWQDLLQVSSLHKHVQVEKKFKAMVRISKI